MTALSKTQVGRQADRHARLLLLLLLFVCVTLACSGFGGLGGGESGGGGEGEGEGEPMQICVPGDSQACTCGPGETGRQRCAADGTRFLDCDCTSAGRPDEEAYVENDVIAATVDPASELVTRVETPSGRAGLDIPPGAVQQATEFTIESRPLGDFVDTDSLLNGIYDFGPDGAVFAEPVILRLPLNGLAVETLGGLTLVSWSERGDGGWQIEPGEVHVDGDHLVAETRHFTPFGIRAAAGMYGREELLETACAFEGMEFQAGAGRTCICESGRRGSTTCTDEGSWSACACEQPECEPGSRAACVCGGDVEGAQGRQLCDRDGFWGACGCGGEGEGEGPDADCMGICIWIGAMCEGAPLGEDCGSSCATLQPGQKECLSEAMNGGLCDLAQVQGCLESPGCTPDEGCPDGEECRDGECVPVEGVDCERLCGVVGDACPGTDIAAGCPEQCPDLAPRVRDCLLEAVADGQCVEERFGPCLDEPDCRTDEDCEGEGERCIGGRCEVGPQDDCDAWCEDFGERCPIAWPESCEATCSGLTQLQRDCMLRAAEDGPDGCEIEAVNACVEIECEHDGHCVAGQRCEGGRCRAGADIPDPEDCGAGCAFVEDRCPAILALVGDCHDWCADAPLEQRECILRAANDSCGDPQAVLRCVEGGGGEECDELCDQLSRPCAGTLMADDCPELCSDLSAAQRNCLRDMAAAGRCPDEEVDACLELEGCRNDDDCPEGRCDLELGDCVCTPQCEDRDCGPDGCGGACGGCGADAICNEEGQCVPDGGGDACDEWCREFEDGCNAVQWPDGCHNGCEQLQQAQRDCLLDVVRERGCDQDGINGCIENPGGCRVDADCAGGGRCVGGECQAAPDLPDLEDCNAVCDVVEDGCAAMMGFLGDCPEWCATAELWRRGCLATEAQGECGDPEQLMHCIQGDQGCMAHDDCPGGGECERFACQGGGCVDGDGDDVCEDDDCDDADPDVGAPRAEECGNGVDDDCDGATDEGCDGDPRCDELCQHWAETCADRPLTLNCQEWCMDLEEPLRDCMSDAVPPNRCNLPRAGDQCDVESVPLSCEGYCLLWDEECGQRPGADCDAYCDALDAEQTACFRDDPQTFRCDPARVAADCSIVPPAQGIETCEELQDVQAQGSYVLVNDIDCSATDPDDPANADSRWAGRGFTPLPDFEGTFDGQGNAIVNLFVQHWEQGGAGLFSSVQGGTVSNLVLDEPTVTGDGPTGALAGGINGEARIEGCAVRGGMVRSQSGSAGGLVGSSSSSTVATSSSTASVEARNDAAGGIVGWARLATFTQVWSTGAVECGRTGAGGAVGYFWEGTIERSWSTADISGEQEAPLGGLVGYLRQATVTESWAAGGVAPAMQSGALTGMVRTDGATVTSSYGNLETSGRDTACGAVIQGGVCDERGLATAQMVDQAGFEGWTFSRGDGDGAVWKMDLVTPDTPSDRYPCLAWQRDDTCPAP